MTTRVPDLLWEIKKNQKITKQYGPISSSLSSSLGLFLELGIAVLICYSVYKSWPKVIWLLRLYKGSFNDNSIFLIIFKKIVTLEKVLIIFFIVAFAYLVLMRKPKEADSDNKNIADFSEELDAGKQKEIAQLKSRLAELESSNSGNGGQYISKIQYDNPELADAFGELDKAMIKASLNTKARLQKHGLDTSKIDDFLKKYYNKL